MAQKEVENYLREGLKQGCRVEDLRDRLLQNGFSEKEVDEAYKNVGEGVKNKSGVYFYFLFFGSVLVLAVVVFFVFLNFAGSNVEEVVGGVESEGEGIKKIGDRGDDVSLIYNAIMEKDVSFCEMIEKEVTREKCKIDVNVELKNLDYCSTVSLMEKIDYKINADVLSLSLKDYCFFKMAKKGLNDSCEFISEEFKEVCQNV